MKAQRKTAVLLIAGPEDENWQAWMPEVRSIMSSGSEMHLYLIDRGVLHMLQNELLDLKSEGLRLYACAYGAARYGVPVTNQAVFCGLTVLSNLLKGCEWLVAISPTHSGDSDCLIWRSPDRESIESNGEKDIVIFIRWSPADSHLSVEGLRIASGLAVGESPVKICLNREASPLLYLDSEEIVDGERRDSYLDILDRAGAVFFAEGESPSEAGSIRACAVDAGRREEMMSNAHRLIVI